MANCLTCIHQEVCEERMAIFNLPNVACQYEERQHGECKTCKHFVKNKIGGRKYVCEHPEIQVEKYYDYSCIMMEEKDFCSRYEPREKEGESN